MKAIDGLSSETIVQLFYKLNTGYYRLLWDNTQSDYKDHELNAVIWGILYCKDISAIWEGNKSKLYRHFLRFRPRIRFICERSAENETMQFGGRYGFGSDSVYMWNSPYSVVRCSTCDRRFEPHQRHCVVSWNKTLYPLFISGLSRELSRHEWKLLIGAQSMNTKITRICLFVKFRDKIQYLHYGYEKKQLYW